MDKIKRVFICIPVPDEVIKEIARIQEQLKNKIHFVGKATELENLHLTLKFLGEINEETLNKTKEAISKVIFNPLNLKLGNIGSFSYKKQPKIIWIKIIGKEIFNLQKQIDESLKDIFPKEERFIAKDALIPPFSCAFAISERQKTKEKFVFRFMSHMTIARIKYVKDTTNMKEYLKHIKPKQISWTSDKILLNESVLKNLGPEYKILETYKSKSD